MNDGTRQKVPWMEGSWRTTVMVVCNIQYYLQMPSPSVVLQISRHAIRSLGRRSYASNAAARTLSNPNLYKIRNAVAMLEMMSNDQRYFSRARHELPIAMLSNTPWIFQSDLWVRLWPLSHSYKRRNSSKTETIIGVAEFPEARLSMYGRVIRHGLRANTPSTKACQSIWLQGKHGAGTHTAGQSRWKHHHQYLRRRASRPSPAGGGGLSRESLPSLVSRL